MDDETALLQGATPAQIAAVPLEKKEERCFADDLGCGLGGFFDAPATAKRDAWEIERVPKVRKYTNKYLVSVLYV